jgi:hypothetical protein
LGPGRLRRPGFQLAELLVSVFIFAIVVGICFYAAAAGFRIFAHTTGRQTLQRDARAIFAWLQRDVGLSNLVRCDREARPTGSDRRDVLAVAALDSWQQPIAVDSLGLPAWNRVVVYQAMSSRNILLRQLFSPATSPIPTPLEFATVDDIVDKIVDGTVGVYNPIDQRRLTSSLRSFSVELSEPRNTAVFNLILSEATVEGGSGRARNEVLQVQTTIFPRNTWPRL